MRCLIIDNYDSFTWNLADYVAQVFGEEPTVVLNDQCEWLHTDEINEFGCIIVSPGPGTVTNVSDFRSSRAALEQNAIPVLGVCLGFQGLAHIYGSTIARADVPYHGRPSTVYHGGTGLFTGIPEQFEAIRYHSLVVIPDSVPDELRVTARTASGILMAVEHKRLPKWGVQFHPESILTQYGKQLVANFRDMAEDYARGRSARRAIGRGWSLSDCAPTPTPTPAPPTRASISPRQLRVYSRLLALTVAAEDAFSHLYLDEEHCFWLDSQSRGAGEPRFSFMGRGNGANVLTHCISTPGAGGEVDAAFLSRLEAELESYSVDGGAELPFEFRGGYVGYMTYEMKRVFGAGHRGDNQVPDAIWMKADRFLAFDHDSGRAWVVAVSDEAGAEAASKWMIDTEAAIASAVPRPLASLGKDGMALRMSLGREEYMAAIAECREKINAGESYEICLTNRFEVGIDLNAFDLYRMMRRDNAAPFGAFIKSEGTYILSTSPERFLKVDAQGRVQAKPIKGTTARATDPVVDAERAEALRHSEKDCAENLMIVDLMRNDLRRVSEAGSISVPSLMAIESFQTVHQMVSTVESKLKKESTLVDLLRATFPGGSITGAPKMRTIDIIDAIELSPRGVYCGTIGYLGYNRICDLNIAIRSLSYDGKTVRFGAGGAITFLSDSSDEFSEVLLKAESIIRPLWSYVSKPGASFDYQLQGRSLRMSPAVTARGSRARDDTGASPWLIPFNRVQNTRLRLFCFPYAGADANIYRSWARSMPDGVEVVGVQYPGRGSHGAPLIDDHVALVDQLHGAIQPKLDCDFAFFGHSNGTLISFELGRLLSDDDKRRHVHHFLSAREPAHLPPKRGAISHLTRDHFVAAVGNLGGTPGEVLDDSLLMDLIIPRLRSDFRLGERYRYRDGPKLACDATVLYAGSDPFVDGTCVPRWSELVEGRVAVHEMRGSHFYLHSVESEVLAIVRNELERVLGSRAC